MCNSSDLTDDDVTSMAPPLSWFARVTTLPMMPGGIDDQLANLSSLLSHVRDAGSDINKAVAWPGADSRTTLKDALRRMGRSGPIERRGRTAALLTPDGSRWLDSGCDPLEIIKILHANIQFVGEFLAEIAKAVPALTHEGARDLASQEYRLEWNSLDPFRRRTTWFRACGLVELEFDHTLVITEAGRQVLEDLELETPSSIALLHESDAVPETNQPIHAPPDSIARIIQTLDQNILCKRKAQIGYIPRGSDIDVVESLRFLVDLGTPWIERNDFNQMCVAKYGIKESSAAAAMSMLLGLGLYTQTGVSRFESTDAARAWLESDSELDLVRIVHANILFVAELLDAIELHDRAPALATYAASAYGMHRQDTNGVRARLHLLLSSGLINEVAWGRYRITALGRRSRDETPRQLAVPNMNPEEDSEPEPGRETLEGPGRSLARELVEAASDADNPTRFETLACDAFSFLGFEAEHLGGAGKTDVILRYSAGPGKMSTIIVDAKSSGSGIVEERAIDFDTIFEHTQRHEADFACVLGPSFNQSRLPERAKRRGAVLLDVEVIATAVLRQPSVALTPQEIARALRFDQGPTAGLADARRAAERRNLLFQHVLAALYSEAAEADEATGGSLSVDNLYFLLRNDLPIRPKPHELEEVVHFLTSPLLGSVSSPTKGQFVASDRPIAVARKLRALADVAEQIERS